MTFALNYFLAMKADNDGESYWARRMSAVFAKHEKKLVTPEEIVKPDCAKHCDFLALACLACNQEIKKIALKKIYLAMQELERTYF